jgi:hypothetical protein
MWPTRFLCAAPSLREARLASFLSLGDPLADAAIEALTPNS